MPHTVLHYLERTAARFAQRPAVTDEAGSITFAELRRDALRIAGAIRERLDGRTHQPVLVYLPKSKECIVSFMGIVYSGNVYTPTSVRFPFSKVQGILDVLQPVLYITDHENAPTLRENGISEDALLFYEHTTANNVNFDVAHALRSVCDTDPVYVLFTSGSTGVPKGVTINHRSIVDFSEWAVSKFGIDETHSMGNQAPFYFDQSMPDIYLCIRAGVCLHIIPEHYFAFPTRLLEYLEEKQINFINWVPSALCAPANRDALKSFKLPCLKKVFFCGEVMPNKQLNYWRTHLPDVLYVNMYGPTEAAHSCTYFIVDRPFADDESLPLGVGDENSDVFLLDCDDRLVAEYNRQGEICIRGSCLSSGYWNNPEKTAEVFVQNPLNIHYPETIYRTGDLAHYNDLGELVFDGRKDFQIKHLGYRIELGEIETAALSLPGVAVASADYDMKEQQIVLFYQGAEVAKRELQKALLGLLPKYMVPTRYVELEAFPYNDNGKIDRRKLRAEYIEVNA